MKYRVRFHLAKGEHYMHWQVRGYDGSVQYWDPKEYQLELVGCRLVNQVNTAKRVNSAGVKDVCGWVECDDYHISPMPVDYLERLYYNPIKDVHWRRESDEGEFDWDNSEYHTLLTYGNQLYILEERCVA